MKLWQKETDSLREVTDFTTGNDRLMDLYLARYDVLGSLAHVHMLGKVNLLTSEEKKVLVAGLKEIYQQIQRGSFVIEPGVEDVHSQVEITLTKKLGEAGKKIHSGRSRNDQVLVDIRLFLRNEIQALALDTHSLFELLMSKSAQYKDSLLPGYTHQQLAMPSSFGLWFGAFSESLVDDMITLHAAWQIVNKNPLGSAAGFGSSFPLDRKLTTDLLGFDDLNYNVVYAQMGRGKTERIVASALSNIASTLAKISSDVCLYLNQNFGFISFPDELTTGSSIMPHKKNPDVFELIRANCNALIALPNEIALLTANLPSGYHRDFQLLKEKIFPAFKTIRDCQKMTGLMLSQIQVRDNILSDEKYKHLFSVEEVNRLVMQGVPFRDAYKKIGQEIEKGTFHFSGKLQHTHEGSMGNLGHDSVRGMMEKVMMQFSFDKVEAALNNLLAKE